MIRKLINSSFDSQSSVSSLAVMKATYQACVLLCLTLADLLLSRIGTGRVLKGHEPGAKEWGPSSETVCQNRSVPPAGASLCRTGQGVAQEEGASGSGPRRSEGDVVTRTDCETIVFDIVLYCVKQGQFTGMCA